MPWVSQVCFQITQTIIAWTLLFYKTDTKSKPQDGFCTCVSGKRLHAHYSCAISRSRKWCIAQSRDCASSVLRNLKITQVMYCVISGFWECATQSRDCANSQIARNIHIPQRTCNDQVSQGYTVWSRRCQTQHQVIRSGMEQNWHTYTISGVSGAGS